jgi:hypothetical protein
MDEGERPVADIMRKGKKKTIRWKDPLLEIKGSVPISERVRERDVAWTVWR